MSLKERVNYFHTQVVTKNLYSAKQAIFRRQYFRLQLTRRSFETIFCALLIFGGQQFLLQNHFYIPLWPATAVALAAIFLRGYFLLLGVFLGSLASFLFHHFSVTDSILFGLLFTAHIFAIRWLTLHLIGALAPLNNRSQFLGFVIIIILVCGAYLACVRALFVPTDLRSLGQLSLGILGEINGILCLLPLSLAFDPFVPKQYFQADGRAWRTGSLILLAAHVLFFYLPPMPTLVLAVALLIAMGSFAYRFGLIPLSITWLMISVFYLSGTLNPNHLFQYDFSPKIVHGLFILFTLNLCVSLWIATGVQQRMITQLRKQS